MATGTQTDLLNRIRLLEKATGTGAGSDTGTAPTTPVDARQLGMVQYVSATGDDNNDGLSPATAKATVAVAVAAITGTTNYGDVYIGPGTFPLYNTLVVPQGVRLHGQSATSAPGGGTVVLYAGPDDGSPAIRTASDVFDADFSFGVLENFRLNCTAGYTQAIGLHARNLQNNSVIRDLFINGFPVNGVYMDHSNTANNNQTFPGYITMERVWVNGGTVPWHIRVGYTSLLFTECAGDDAGSNTVTDAVVIDPALSGTRGGRDVNVIFVGFKSEDSGSGHADRAGFTVNVDCGLTLIGCCVKCANTGSKAFLNYTVAPASPNVPAGGIPVEIIQCHTQNMPTFVAASAVTPAINVAVANATAGEAYHQSWSGFRQATTWMGTHRNLVANGLSIGMDAVASPGLHIDPVLNQTANTIEVAAFTLIDEFNRANSTTTMGTADTGGAWSVKRGTWGINTNKAYLVSTTVDALVTLDPGVTDGTLSCDITLSGVRAFPGIAFRTTPASDNYYALKLKQATNEIILGTYAATNLTHTLGDWTQTLTLGATYNVKIVFTGSLLTVYLNGNLLGSVTDTTYASQTPVGIVHSISLTEDDGGSRYDNFTFSTVTNQIDSTGVAHLQNGVIINNGPALFTGTGAPSLTAPQGSLYLRADGSSTSTRAYINTNGSTTWTAVTTAT